MVDELKTLRAIANRIVMGVGKYLSHEDLIAAFTLRSKRLVVQEALGQYIARSRSPTKRSSASCSSKTISSAPKTSASFPAM